MFNMFRKISYNREFQDIKTFFDFFLDFWVKSDSNYNNAIFYQFQQIFPLARCNYQYVIFKCVKNISIKTCHIWYLFFWQYWEVKTWNVSKIMAITDNHATY